MSRNLCRQIGATWLGICLMMVLAFCFPTRSEAGLVYGHVSDEKGKLRPGDTFSVQVSAEKVVKVKTDEQGNYRVFLPPGIYTVEFPDGRKAEILSHPEPLKQDIHLK